MTLAGYAIIEAAIAHAGPAWRADVLLPGFAVLGFGQGLFLTPLINVVLERVQPELAGSAAGILATAQQAGSALGVAIVGLFYFGALDGGPAGFRHGFQLALGYAFGASALCFLLLRGLDAADRRHRARVRAEAA